MAKTPLQVYVRIARDRCAHRDDGYTCGIRQASHPTNLNGRLHEFKPSETEFVYPTNAERRAIYEQLKEEFDAD